MFIISSRVFTSLHLFVFLFLRLLNAVERAASELDASAKQEARRGERT